MRTKKLIVGLLAAGGVWWGCAKETSGGQRPTTPPRQIAQSTDGGTDAGVTEPIPDAGTTDSGSPDAGTPDAGAPDAGPPKAIGYALPNLPGWQFFGVQNNGPVHVYGTAIDQGGNLWVAGGEEGLFLMTPAEQAKGASAQFRQITMDDGSGDPDAALHPWGYMPDGGADAPGPHYLDVISVAGGPAGTVFVGYRGKGWTSAYSDPCETNWDGKNPDPSIYKSGDADRVELQSDGSLKVVHYDIFSGPGMVGHEPRGREHVCSIFKIHYDPNHNSVWFGGNHGFAWGDPKYPGIHAMPSGLDCTGKNYGNYKNGCSGLLEHAHPWFTCYPDGPGTSEALCTWRYYGIDEDSNGRLWVGGWQRSMTWMMNHPHSDFWGYEGNQQTQGWPTAIDIWPDAKPDYSTASEWNDDGIMAVVALDNGTAYFASAAKGIAQLDANSGSIHYFNSGLTNELTSAARDPSTGDTVWFGGVGGISILRGGGFTNLDHSYFGNDLTGGRIIDIQGQLVNGARKMVVGFKHKDTMAGIPDQGPDAVGVYSGPGIPTP